MEVEQLMPHIEALIFAADKALNKKEIADLVNQALNLPIPQEQIDKSIEGIEEKYSSSFYSFGIVQSGGGYQFLTKKEYHSTIIQLNADKFTKKLSTAALETLSIVAYRQPISKNDIEQIRGVNSDYSVQKLLEKDLILISGRNDALPGKPLMYQVSKNFLDYFGINGPEDLPKLKEVFPDELVIPTSIDIASS